MFTLNNHSNFTAESWSLDDLLAYLPTRHCQIYVFRMKPSLPSRISLLALALVLFACNSASKEEPAPALESTNTTIDGIGRNVDLPENIKRVVSLAPGATEIVYASGAIESLVGVTTADNYPSIVTGLPSFSALPVNFESIIGLEPDLIVASSQVNNPDDAEIFRQVGIPVYFLESRSLDDIVDSIRELGSILGTSTAANAAADSLESRIQMMKNATMTIQTRPRILLLLSASSMYSFGSGSYVQDLIWIGGGESITAELPQEAVNLSEEFVITTRPDIILGTFPEGTTVSDFLENHPEWSDVPAIKNSAIFAISPDLILRPGPRNVDGIETIMKILHPILAASILTEQL
jgi:iron complex transport system substrate-binding protein